MTVVRYIPMIKTVRPPCAEEDEWWTAPRETTDVIIEARDPEDIGLVDEHGTPIMRVTIRHPIGFCR